MSVRRLESSRAAVFVSLPLVAHCYPEWRPDTDGRTHQSFDLRGARRIGREARIGASSQVSQSSAVRALCRPTRESTPFGVECANTCCLKSSPQLALAPT